MSLFQKSVEKKYLSELNEAVINSKYTSFQEYFGNSERQENIRNSKEEQFQEGFLRELFVNIFEYTLNPEPGFNMITELKNVSNSKKADGAILNVDGDAVAVIELKSRKTPDLDSIETQAFGYKNHQPKCVYVVTSNFEKLRFYIEDAIDYIDFDLFNLTRDKFTLMWLCLSKDSLLNNCPLDIKKSSIVREEDITKKLYTDYSAFRKAVFNNLMEKNPDKDKLLLFKKTQKLLDRFLFIFFAEDRLLLPPNSINRIIGQWESLKDLDEYSPLFSRFKKFFSYMDKGFKGKSYDIFAYNGGLFKPDEVLDNILIDDDILLEHTQKLSQYNFDTDVDVNILGHIFEHSLVEIESIHAEINGEVVDSNKSKRKKDGIFYTPKYITQYIVENTIGRLCKEKRAELGIVDEDYTAGRKNRKKTTIIALDEKLSAYRVWLLGLTILDPACGSGAFLNQALDFLIREHQKINVLDSQLHEENLGLHDIETDILERNIYGVDINEESVEIAKLSLWLRTAQKGRKLNTLNNNIKCGNSLIDDPEVAGDRAFNWQKEFPEVFNNGGFDVVIGNPPYVRAELLGVFREYLENNYSVYNSAGDLFSYFYEKSFKLLKSITGLFGFISNTFDKTTAGISVREYLQKEVAFLKYIDFTEVKVFEGATTYPVILIAQNNKENNNNFNFIKIPKSSQSTVINIALHSSVKVKQNSLEKENWSFKSNISVELINKLRNNKTIREIYGKSYRGLLTGLNEAFIIKKSYEIGEHLKPIFEGKELSKWVSSESVQQLILFKSKWTKKEFGNDITETSGLNILQNTYPELISFILPLKERAQKRYDKGDFFWELRNCAYYDLFEKSKIVFPNLQNSNKFSFDETGSYINAPAVILPTDDKFLISILNSKLVWYFLTNICVVRSGGYIEVKPQYFEQIPLPVISNQNKIDLKLVTEKIISSTSESQKISIKFIKLLNSKFEDLNITNKLKKWFYLSFTDFQKELKKQKIKLSLTDASDWMDFLEQQTKSYIDLSNTISFMETEIDQMVYELYGLSEDEIAIVEGR